MLGIELAGGALIFGLFILGYTLAVTFGLYGRRGSGIAQHPYGNAYGGAPGAYREGRMSGSADREVLTWTRGTR